MPVHRQDFLQIRLLGPNWCVNHGNRSHARRCPWSTAIRRCVFNIRPASSSQLVQQEVARNRCFYVGTQEPHVKFKGRESRPCQVPWLLVVGPCRVLVPGPAGWLVVEMEQTSLERGRSVDHQHAAEGDETSEVDEILDEFVIVAASIPRGSVPARNSKRPQNSDIASQRPNIKRTKVVADGDMSLVAPATVHPPFGGGRVSVRFDCGTRYEGVIRMCRALTTVPSSKPCKLCSNLALSSNYGFCQTHRARTVKEDTSPANKDAAVVSRLSQSSSWRITIDYDDGEAETTTYPSSDGSIAFLGNVAVDIAAAAKPAAASGRAAKPRPKCPHGRRKACCKECGGGSICQHGRIRSVCKECGGGGICQHDRARHSCRECISATANSPPASAKQRPKCPHGRRKAQCKECGGGSICEHGRIRSVCKECGGASICQHGRGRSQCRDCGGTSVCIHGRQRSQCKLCGGASICPHGRRRSLCKVCGGAGICAHGRQRPQCKECGGSGICPHGRLRVRCNDCGGSGMCQHSRRREKCKEPECVSITAAKRHDKAKR
jgi:hypothetical protein